MRRTGARVESTGGEREDKSDGGGRERRGTLEGDTARHVRQLLREQHLLPVSVAEVTQTEAKRAERRFTWRRGLSAADLSLVTRQLATLLKADIARWNPVLKAAAEKTN